MTSSNKSKEIDIVSFLSKILQQNVTLELEGVEIQAEKVIIKPLEASHEGRKKGRK